MVKNLVIVESPAKAKTIEGFLGKDYLVKSSIGHIRDLPKKDMGIDIENGFQPKYEVSTDKKKTVTELKKLAKDAEIVWLATDEDREGEAIAWHLYETLGLTPSNTKRIVFHEITKNAIIRAVENPREIDINLVNAQQARRVLDRLVGFEVSPVLWRKVKTGLSAGRVQSVAVRVLVEREREIIAFTPENSFRIQGFFKNSEGVAFQAEAPSRPSAREGAEQALQACVSATFTVNSVEKRPGTKKPAAPFTTSTLQQEAARKLGFSVAQTMSVAQRLYESGLITYMRTDSTNLSQDALGAAAAEIKSAYGEEYSKTRQYTTKSDNAQEAHEAIRPTYMNRHSAGADHNQERLYELIWKRTIASQMSEAKLERTTVKIVGSGEAPAFTAKGEVLVFDGFLKVYLEGTDDEGEEQAGMLPRMSEGETLNVDRITATERFSKHPPRYTEASLVKKLEELGIGRPSTYAPTISTILARNYVEKTEKQGVERAYEIMTMENGAVRTETATEITGAEKNKLFPTDIGMVVTDFLVQEFGNILDLHFTAHVEEEFDKIAQGQEEWNNMIQDFYKPFHDAVQDVQENAERATGERQLGEDPKSGKPVIARIGRFGPMIQIGSVDDEEKPRFASLRKDQHIETITFEEAMELFKLPRELGEYEGEVIKANIGRFGPYVQQGRLFASLPKEENPMSVTLDRAIELIEAKKEADKNKFIQVFDEEEPVVQVLNGRYGPYIKIGRQNIKIPKDVDPKSLTREECLRLQAEAPKTKKRGGARRTKKS